MNNFFIATEGRAGSTLLCQHLKQMGIGTPNSYLSSEFFHLVGSSEYPDVRAYIESKRRNGYLGLKISWGMLIKMYELWEVEMNVHAFLDDLMPDGKYIYLTRRDRVHQALSRIKHIKMDTSHVRGDEKHAAYLVKEKELFEKPVPVDDIHLRLYTNNQSYAAWDIYFRAYPVEMIRVDFEDLVADRDGVLTKVCAFLGAPLRLDLLKERLIPTHTRLNDKWYSRVMEGYLKYV